MPVTAVCPFCGTSYQVQPSLRGKSMRCPMASCRKTFTVATAEPPAAEPDWWVQTATTAPAASPSATARRSRPRAIDSNRLAWIWLISASAAAVALLFVAGLIYLLAFSPKPTSSVVADAGDSTPPASAAPAQKEEASPNPRPVPKPAASAPAKKPEEKRKEPPSEKPAASKPEPPRSPLEPPRVEKPAAPKPEPPKPPAEKPQPRKEEAPVAADLRLPDREMFTEPPLDNSVYLRIKFSADHRFGVTLSDAAGPLAGKRLTFAEDGVTNNACVYVNGQTFLYRSQGPVVPSSDGLSWTSTANYLGGKVRLTQEVRIRRGEESRKLDTCRVHYTFENRDSQPQQVGLRFMLDTLIGANDGVPFTIPGQPGLCARFFQSKSPTAVPDYVQALEKPNLTSPGTVAQLTVKVPDPDNKLEPPARLLLTHWPGGNAGWTVRLYPILQDSAAVLYWPAKPLGPGQKRAMAFDYGLGSLSGNEGNGSLALTLGGSLQVGGELTVVAYVNKPTPGLTVTLEVPAGLKVLDNTPLTQRLAESQSQGYTQVSWRLRSEKPGKYKIRAALSNGASQSKDVVIRPGLSSTGPVAVPLGGSK